MTWMLIVLSLSLAGEPNVIVDSKHKAMFDCFQARALYLGNNPEAHPASVICLEHKKPT